MTYKHVLLLAGGPSTERDVSLSAAANIESTLKGLGYRVTVLDPVSDLLLSSIASIRPDVVYNALHGSYGEDGVVQSVLEIAGVPYTHSGVATSAIAMNKAMTKDIAHVHGVKVPQSLCIKAIDCFDALRMKADIGVPMPYVIKPIAQGSTVGVYVIKSEQSRNNVLQHLGNWHYGENLLVEEYIPGRELTVAVLHGKALGVLEIIPHDTDLLDYNAKYLSEKTEYIVPARIPHVVYERAMKAAEIVHHALGCRTMSRSDFRYDEKNEAVSAGTGHGNDECGDVHFLEINTQPGMMCGHSLVPKIAGYNGITFATLVQALVEDANCEHCNRSQQW